MIAALISQSNGLAIFDDGQRVGVMDVLAPDSPEYPDPGLIESLTARIRDAEAVSVTDLSALASHLEIRRLREELLRAAIILIDSGNSDDLRSAAADAVRRLYRADHWRWVEGIFFASPFPKETDLGGVRKKWADIYDQQFLDLAKLQPVIRKLRTSWFALPDSLFHTETREQILAKATRYGLFRNLAKGSHRAGPFSTALAHYAEILARSTASQGSDPAEVLVRDGVPEEYATHELRWLWDVAPWRTAWLAEGWSHFECRAVRRVANDCLTDPTSAHGTERDEAFYGRVLARLSSFWDKLISRVGLSDWLTHLDLLESNFARMHHFADFSTNELITQARQETPYLSFSYLLLRYFDAPPLYKRALGIDELSAATGESVHAQVLAHHVQSLCQTDLDFGVLDAKTYVHGQEEALDCMSQLRQVVGVHGLRKIFRKNGGIVVVLDQLSPLTRRTLDTSVVFLNPAQPKKLRFDSFRGAVVNSLRSRLAADIDSGLPFEYCGWVEMKRLGHSVGGSVHEDVVREIRNRLAEAGFSVDLIESDSQRIRLNPDLTAAIPDGESLPLQGG